MEKPRPVSEVTEMYDTDFEDDLDDEIDDNESEFEEFAADYEFQSNEGRRSQTTISTFEEVSTPHSSRRIHFDIRAEVTKPVEGPRGPHLFRSSQASSVDFTFEYALQLSPLSPKEPERTNTAFSSDRTITTITGLTPSPEAAIERGQRLETPDPELDWDDVHVWTTQQVSIWMCKSCIDYNIIEQFETNDINGAVLMDMQFEDLKELGIQSFGKRHTLWNQICALRGGEGRVSPVATPFQDIDGPCSLPRSDSVPGRLRSQDSCGDFSSGKDDCVTPGGAKRRHGRKHRRRHNGDAITPAESVSIVAIEQLLPKPHKCAKGERCSKWRKQQRQFKRLQEEHGFPISPDKGGHIYISGDPGNALTAPNIVDDVHRPTSEAMPSVVASSDLLGPSLTPEFALEEGLVQKVQERDPQDNVRKFLALQHVEPPNMVPQTPIEGPPSSKFEMFPPQPTGLQPLPHMLQSLPKLTIPRSSSAQPAMATPNGCHSAIDMSTIDAIYSAHFGVMSPNRYGTPCSEMDVPTSAFQLGPVARETTQSVPPDMHFRSPIARTGSRADWRRPSFALPRVNEHEVFSPARDNDQLSTMQPSNSMPIDTNGEHKTTPITLDGEESSPYPGASHAGWMKKRKTKLLRHEWNDQHVRLHGTALSMHPTSSPTSVPLDTLNIDEYAVACSSLASNSKLAAKLKALRIVSGAGKKDGADAAAFSFQLVPSGKDGEEQSVVRRAVAGGKTHHFAVRSRDERIDWMRELMLAKALQAKRDGFEVEVNGNAI